MRTNYALLPTAPSLANSDRKYKRANKCRIAILLKNIAEQLQLENAEIHEAQRYQPGHDDDENPGNF
jgi:hypothetical protein